MTASRIASALSVVAVFCILALFFFPVLSGPYSAVHGPVSALLSIRAAGRLRSVIRAGVAAARSWLARTCLGLAAVSFRADSDSEIGPTGRPARTFAILRC